MTSVFTIVSWLDPHKKPNVHRFFVWAIFLVLGPLAIQPAAAQSQPDQSQPDQSQPDQQTSDEEALILTEDEAVRRALSLPERTDIWQAQVAGAKAQALSRGAWPNPQVQYSREQTFEDNQAISEDFVLLEQALPLSGRRGLLADAARKRAEAIRLEALAQGRHISLRVRQAFYQALYRQRRMEVRRQWLGRMKEAEEALAQRVDAGESAPYELERLRKELAEIQASMAIDQAMLDTRRTDLAALLGMTSAETQKSLRMSGQILPDALPTDQQLRASIQNRPEFVAARERIEAARLETQAASRWWIPEPTLTGGYKGADSGNIDAERFHGFVAGIALAVPVFNQHDGERKAADAALVRAKSQQQLIERRLNAEVLGLAQPARRLKKAAQTYRTQGVERAQRVLEMARQSYFGGEVGILELLDAYRGAIDSQLRALDLSAETRELQIELRRSLDRLDDIESRPLQNEKQ
jgi:cobalt-zinc-cadmium efflux system outer membrane protein